MVCRKSVTIENTSAPIQHAPSLRKSVSCHPSDNRLDSIFSFIDSILFCWTDTHQHKRIENIYMYIYSMASERGTQFQHNNLSFIHEKVYEIFSYINRKSIIHQSLWSARSLFSYTFPFHSIHVSRNIRVKANISLCLNGKPTSMHKT